MTILISKTTDIDACLALRFDVFVHEQKVPADEELDDLDPVSVHFLACDTHGNNVGTARVYEVGSIGKIGRVCVVKSHRGTGLGKRLIEACLQDLHARPHITQAKLGAQNHAIAFYEGLGFSVVGGEYMDGGIPHHDMVRAL
ncbi:GNAT family N-acetyltransferase [Celeribacter sp.]|uniref:GNAT family N-acetyltransferase n=1 Tax=Celeribacter sp. TaxID=1890673 RepID=UPI003A93B1AF